MGEGADGRWDLTVTLPGEGPRRFEGPSNGSAGFGNLTWLGWVSNAGENTSFYLDDVDLTSR